MFRVFEVPRHFKPYVDSSIFYSKENERNNEYLKIYLDNIFPGEINFAKLNNTNVFMM